MNVLLVPLSNLHSTMFIFIFAKILREAELFRFTFHYVYIYIPRGTAWKNFTRFTFHYVYIYIVHRIGKTEESYIYIPLCLYLYYSTGNHESRWGRIYIPLCLYLYCLPGTLKIINSKIYIPLCLYLYG